MHAMYYASPHERADAEEGAMETVMVRVKWQKQKYEVNVRLGAPTEEFKSQVSMAAATS